MKTTNETPILISVQELKLLGFFPRCQDIDKLLSEKTKNVQNLFGYPLFKTRLEPNPYIDIVAEDGRWIKVKFTKEIEAYLSQKTIKYIVAPAGYYTDNNMEVSDFKTIEFDDSKGTIFKDRTIQSSKVIDVSGPYITFDIKWYNSDSKWVEEEDFRYSKHTFHVSDPRIKINNTPGKEHYFNEPIAVSHRWLSSKMPDPDGLQYLEFLNLCEQLDLHDSQPILFDYCSLPQHPRTNEEESFFNKQLPVFQQEFIQNVIVLNEGSSDYETRAWCMLELMLSAFQDSIINENTIEKNLNVTIKKAKDYVTHAGWKDDSMQKHFMSGVTNKSFKQWSSDLTNVAIYNTVISKRQEIENLFSSELQVTNEDDREIVLELVRKFCFSRG